MANNANEGAQAPTGARQWLNSNAVLLVVALSAAAIGYSLYESWARSNEIAAIIAKAVDIARNQVGPKLEAFKADKHRLPAGNFELDLPNRAAISWQPLNVVDVLPDGSVYFQYVDPAIARTRSMPIFVWRLQDSKSGKANTCAAANVLPAALQRNGLVCDINVPPIQDPASMANFHNAELVANDPKRAEAEALRAGAKLNASKTPADRVMDAIARDSDKTLAKMKSDGVDICRPDPAGRLPLAEAARSNQTKTLAALIAAKCDLQQLEPYSQQTALTGAVILRNIDATISLLVAGADANFANPAGIPPLLLLGSSGDSVTMYLREALRRHGADLEIRDHEGYTLLMRAADRGSRPLAKWLIGNGAKLDAKDGEGKTALMHAILSTNGDDVAAMLIAGKADVNQRDAQGTTALGMTRLLQDSQRQQKLEKMLRNAGGQI